jgi:hypothetical protein
MLGFIAFSPTCYDNLSRKKGRGGLNAVEIRNPLPAVEGFRVRAKALIFR